MQTGDNCCSGKVGTVAEPLSGIDIAGLEWIGRIRSAGLREGGPLPPAGATLPKPKMSSSTFLRLKRAWYIRIERLFDDFVGELLKL